MNLPNIEQKICFACPCCGKHIYIDAAKTPNNVLCTSCNKTIEVPLDAAKAADVFKTVSDRFVK